MSLLVYKISEYEHTAEREQYRELCKQLQGFYGRRYDIFLFIANYNINDCELDGLLIKPDGIIVLEFKNYGGKVIATDNGEWTCNGTVVKGGSHKTVYQQIRTNRAQTRNGCVAGGIFNSITIRDLAALVVFHHNIALDNRLPLRTQSWFHICDETTFLEKVHDITSRHTDLSRDQMLALIDKLSLQREYLDEEYSNVEVLPNNPKNVCTQSNPAGEHTHEELQSSKGEVADMLPTIDPPPYTMKHSVMLPQWLDNFIYNQKGGTYEPVCSEMTVIDWNRADLLKYLGTYFPRSYAESYCLFDYIFHRDPSWNNRTDLSVFDFGCGTGGEAIGMLAAISENLSNIRSINIKAQDGSTPSLRFCEEVTLEMAGRCNVPIMNAPLPFLIEDSDDLDTMASVLQRDFDIIIASKTLCEFVSKNRLGGKNPYEQFTRVLLPKLKTNGLILITDVTVHDQQENDWIPHIMDKGLDFLDTKIYSVERNDGYNDSFAISHSYRQKDSSKIAWRIITRKKS